jgi:signal transduction histidine kinase/CheY-like chemotaxis protein
MGIEQMQMDLAQHYQTLPGTLDTLDILSEQSAVVSRILNDSLSMQKIEDGALVLEYDNFSLERMIRGALYAFRTPCLEKKLRVRVSLQSLDALVSQTLPGLRLGKATLVSTSNSRGRGGGIGGGGGGMLAAGALHNHNIAVDGNGAGAMGSPLQDGAAVGGDDNGGIDGNAQAGAVTGGISMMGGESGVGVSIGGGGTSTAPGDGLSSAAGGLFAGGGGRQSHMQSHTIGSDTNVSQGQNTIVYHANVRGDPYRLRQVLANFVSVSVFPLVPILPDAVVFLSAVAHPSVCFSLWLFVCLLAVIQNAVKFTPNGGLLRVSLDVSRFEANPLAVVASDHLMAQLNGRPVGEQKPSRSTHASWLQAPPGAMLGHGRNRSNDSAALAAAAAASSGDATAALAPSPTKQQRPPPLAPLLPELLGTVMVRVAVKDSGNGIPVAHQAHIFEAYTQIAAGTLQKGNGTGLGLNISKSIVELHGGQIGYTSVAGEGCEFYFSLPLDVMLVKSGSSRGGDSITSSYGQHSSNGAPQSRTSNNQNNNNNNSSNPNQNSSNNQSSAAQLPPSRKNKQQLETITASPDLRNNTRTVAQNQSPQQESPSSDSRNLVPVRQLAPGASPPSTTMATPATTSTPADPATEPLVGRNNSSGGSLALSMGAAGSSNSIGSSPQYPSGSPSTMAGAASVTTTGGSGAATAEWRVNVQDEDATALAAVGAAALSTGGNGNNNKQPVSTVDVGIELMPTVSASPSVSGSVGASAGASSADMAGGSSSSAGRPPVPPVGIGASSFASSSSSSSSSAGTSSSGQQQQQQQSSAPVTPPVPHAGGPHYSNNDLYGGFRSSGSSVNSTSSSSSRSRSSAGGGGGTSGRPHKSRGANLGVTIPSVSSSSSHSSAQNLTASVRPGAYGAASAVAAGGTAGSSASIAASPFLAGSSSSSAGVGGGTGADGQTSGARTGGTATAASAAAGSGRAGTAGAGAGAGSSSPLSGTRVLVVEDSAPNRKLLMSLLTHMGCKSFGVENGQECVELFKDVMTSSPSSKTHHLVHFAPLGLTTAAAAAAGASAGAASNVAAGPSTSGPTLSDLALAQMGLGTRAFSTAHYPFDVILMVSAHPMVAQVRVWLPSYLISSVSKRARGFVLIVTLLTLVFFCRMVPCP